MRSSPPPLLLSESSATASELPSLTTIAARKRRFSHADELSSDPLFSDELSDVGLPEEGHRRKRQLKCPWWDLTTRRMSARAQESLVPTRMSRHRGVDSGIWMGSDEDLSATQSSDELQEIVKIKESPCIATPASLAAARIAQCLEDGNEVVDLSDLGLAELDPYLLQPLQHLIRRTVDDRDRPPSEEDYKPLIPRLQLYLSGNQLRNIPSQMLQLPITVLSLRNNLLTSLPHNIGKLSGLTELNVGGNQLQYLPWSLMHVAGCGTKTAFLQPNPFLSLDLLKKSEYESVKSALHKLRKTLQVPSWIAVDKLSGPVRHIYLLSSRVSYFGSNGRPLQRQAPSTDRFAPCFELNSVQDGLYESSVPSLFELAVRKAQTARLPAAVSQLLPKHTPSAVLAALQTAADNQHIGNEECSVCGREMIIARAEWVEYYYVARITAELSDDTVVPYLRRACSTYCAKPAPSIVHRQASNSQHQRSDNPG